MNQSSSNVSKLLLPDNLFWDCEKPATTEEWTKFYFFVIERVIQRGDLDSFSDIRKFYGDKKIKEVFINSRRLSPRARSFGKAVFDVEYDEKCSQIPSDQKLWNY